MQAVGLLRDKRQEILDQEVLVKLDFEYAFILLDFVEVLEGKN